jgi:hypothetical protein
MSTEARRASWRLYDRSPKGRARDHRRNAAYTAKGWTRLRGIVRRCRADGIDISGDGSVSAISPEDVAVLMAMFFPGLEVEA